jgi:excisionase family DNA binding protein
VRGPPDAPRLKRFSHQPVEHGLPLVTDDRPTVTPQERNLLISIERGVLLRIEAAAILLGIGRTKMYELIRRGQIPVVRIGRRTLVHRADLEHFGQTHRDTTYLATVPTDVTNNRPTPTGFRDPDMS